MANFAVLDGEIVINTILAESKEIAEQVTGMVCIEFNQGDNAEPGGTYVNNIFIPRKPYPSWILNENNSWEAPVAPPQYDAENPKKYTWNESTLSWVEL